MQWLKNFIQDYQRRFKINYIEYINKLIRNSVKKEKEIVLYGQNISAGSCISGLTKGLEVNDHSKIINTPNSENSLVGFGFGLLLNGVNSIFFMKQLDFLFLGIDQLTNTYNYIRTIQPKASFTIVPVIVDSGYEGMMASTNNLSDFCAISKIPGYTISNKIDSMCIIKDHLIAPGFRIIGVSQRLFKKPLLLEDSSIKYSFKENIFQYAEGNDLTIVCFNLSFPQSFNLVTELKKRGIKSSLFSVNRAYLGDYSSIIKDVEKTNNIVVIDDSKSDNKLFHPLLTSIYENTKPKFVDIITRKLTDDQYVPNPDIFDIKPDDIINRFIKSSK